MDVVQLEQGQDTDLMPKCPKVISPTSLDLGVEQVPSDQEDIEILEDNLEAYVHNISFNEST